MIVVVHVVVFVFVFFIVVVLGGVVVIVVVMIVGHRNLTLKFGQNWVNNSCNIVFVVIDVVVVDQGT